MTKEGFKRKLTAIFSADVVGYSRLMDDNEEATVQTLTAYRETMTNLIQKHQGRIIDSPGDNLLAEFSSVVDAVKCAVEVQRELAERNNKLSDNRKMEFRIGVNLSDVVEEADRIYGGGVNIAARLEGLAEPRGICISRAAYDHVKNKLELGYEYLGEQSVKNIAEPVRVYRVLMEPEAVGKVIGENRFLGRFPRKTAIASIMVLLVVAGGLFGWNIYLQQLKKVEPASVEKMAFPLPEKPSIAVLPFDNMSDDPKQEYFSDGIAEEIITSLSKTDQLFVIARNSSFVYKGKPVKIKQVAEELGVRYVLEGSVRKTEDRVRITAQLIDATTGHHLWSERFDRDLKDILALQDEITMEIVRALEINLTEGEQARMWAKKFVNLEDYLKRMEAQSLFRQGTVESQVRHRQLAQEIIDIAPESPEGYMMLGWNYYLLARFGKSPQENLKKAVELAQKAISLDESYYQSYALLGSLYTRMRQFEKAIAAGKRSIGLNPNGALVHGLLGKTLIYAGKPDEAIRHLHQGIRLNPFPAYWYFSDLGRCYLLKGQYEKALTEFKKALQRSPKAVPVHLYLAVTYILLDREEEARVSAANCLELAPFVSVDWFLTIEPYKNQADLKRISDAMRKAGFPE